MMTMKVTPHQLFMAFVTAILGLDIRARGAKLFFIASMYYTFDFPMVCVGFFGNHKYANRVYMLPGGK